MSGYISPPFWNIIKNFFCKKFLNLPIECTLNVLLDSERFNFFETLSNGKSRQNTTRYQTERFICNMVTPKVSQCTTDMVIQSRKHTGNKVALPELDACCAYCCCIIWKPQQTHFTFSISNFNLEILFLWIVY